MTGNVAEPAGTRGRQLLLVAGSGRSGTSVFSLVMRELGFHVPKPEVPHDESNPHGFAESQWVVDFHTRLLREATIHPSDARPAAWLQTGQLVHLEAVRDELREWLGQAYGEHDDVIVKDPRLAWFLPLWQRCADDLEATASVVTMLRHPAQVVHSKDRAYGSRQDATSRTAGWLNMMLFSERASRDLPRAFVSFDELLDDWTRPVSRAATRLHLTAVGDRGSPAMRRARRVIDPAMRRSQVTWDDLDVGDVVRRLAESCWNQLTRLPDHDGESSVLDALDAQRADYVALYEEAESIARSSLAAAHRSARAGASPPAASTPDRRPDGAATAYDRLTARVPERLRAGIASALRRRTRRVLATRTRDADAG